MKKLLLGMLLGFTATAAGAQGRQGAQSDPGPITAVLGSGTGQYVRWLTAAFDSIPESEYVYRATPVQRSIGEIAAHLEHANYLLCAKFGDMPYRMTAKDSLADSIKARWPKDTLTARLKASFDFCRSAWTKLSDKNLADELTDIAGTPGRILGHASPCCSHLISSITGASWQRTCDCWG
jgi:hypothetical protein